MNCPSCGVEFSTSDRFCRQCGAPRSSLSQAPTAAAESPAAAVFPAPVGRLISSDSLPVGGFTPGMVLANRYRIIGLIGRGGMGEVYRADDLKLGQPVALKFLPKALADDPVRRERLFAEVRIARQVSHPNICRVYDIGEMEGRHFLTMEYIDGEDLASLLKRIGSLHGAKALDVARQLCAGLAAAHDKGVLHRDLKPANVMIDGRGHVRITDFGLAVAAGEEVSAEDVSGTPPYMAPEQFAGKGASVRSDIYALGLIFYEVFTGRRAFEAKTLAELRAKKETSSPTAPSEIVRDIDPIVERVILRCIEKDPRQRPASVAQVASALPGGDPLAAAIAAGETPSPEMVAASGSTEGLKPWIAWACLAFILLSIGIAVSLKRQTALQRVPIENPPEALAVKAKEILKDIGYTNPPADSAYGFGTKDAYFRYVEKSDKSPNRFDNVPAFAVQFWYRQSPQPLQHWAIALFWQQGVTLSDPPFKEAGESAVWLDSRGNLVGLQIIPGEEPAPSGAAQTPDWSVLFKASRIDPAKGTPVEPDRKPPLYADKQSAWEIKMPDRPDVPMRIEAASWRGRPVSWRLSVPSWENFSVPVSTPAAPEYLNAGIYDGYLISVLVLVAGGSFFARRNLRMGRGDRRGATRLAIITFVLAAIAWVFGDHHVASLGELYQFACSAAVWLLVAACAWLAYIALEPFMRRRLPGLMVSWSRLLSGSFRDSLVGRDLLIGCMAGVALVLVTHLRFPLARLVKAPQINPSGMLLTVLEALSPGRGTLPFFSGTPAIVSFISDLLLSCLTLGLWASFWIFLLLFLLKRRWAVVIFFLVIASAGNILIGNASLLLSVLIVLALGIDFFILFRFGILAYVAMIFSFNLLISFPITMQPSSWYFGIGLTGLAILLAFAGYAFHTSLGGQPMFGRASLED
jgi:serine/threonine protein kinase